MIRKITEPIFVFPMGYAIGFVIVRTVAGVEDYQAETTPLVVLVFLLGLVSFALDLRSIELDDTPASCDDRIGILFSGTLIGVSVGIDGSIWFVVASVVPLFVVAVLIADTSGCLELLTNFRVVRCLFMIVAATVLAIICGIVALAEATKS